MIDPATPAPRIAGRQPIDRHVFRCARCHQNGLQVGRKRRFVLGLASWVCAPCIAREPKKEVPP